MIFVNFKTYRQGSGKRAVELAKICQETSREMAISIIPIVQTLDLWRIKQTVKIPVWVQHVDGQEPGPFTGFTNLEAVIQAKASGTLLNHSEHPLSFPTLQKTAERIKKAGENFQVMICARNLTEIGRLMALQANYLAYEPPELIGSQTKSVAKTYPEIISQAVKKVSPLELIVGAGINSFQDVTVSLKLGAKGVLVSSSVVLSKDPKEKLRELTKGFF